MIHHVVTAGESFTSIARKYCPPGTLTSVVMSIGSKIAVANGVAMTATLYAGRVLHIDETLIPSIVPPVVSTPPFTPPPPPPSFIPIGLNAVPAPRGVVPTSGWWSTNMTYCTGRATDFVNDGFNFLRLNCWHDDASGYSIEDFIVGAEKAIDEYTARGVVVMPANHEWTADREDRPTWDSLVADPFFFPHLDRMIAKGKTNPNVWINPLNEPWRYDNKPAMLALYGQLYTYIRASGFVGNIVFDLPGWAQDISFASSSEAGNFLAGKTNVLFGFHNYEASTVLADNIKALGVKIIISEAGYDITGAATPSFNWTVANAKRLGWGCVAWWGAGNRNNRMALRNTGNINQTAAWFERQYPLSSLGTAMLALATK